VLDFSEHVDVPSGSIEAGNFLNQLNDYKLPKKEPAQTS
jgi:hypothetical protein